MELFVLTTLPTFWRAHMPEHNSCLFIIPFRAASDLICRIDDSSILLKSPHALSRIPVCSSSLSGYAYLTISERTAFDHAYSVLGSSHTAID